jgi:hypothetical protein
VLHWLPLLPPLLLFVARIGLLVWSVIWMADGWTLGERATQQGYLLGAVTAGVLSYSAYFSIKRADLLIVAHGISRRTSSTQALNISHERISSFRAAFPSAVSS